jgi:transcriptional regulator|nr:MAG TPA: helix-turn-helix domain protein [Caudoviricetes sp.]
MVLCNCKHIVDRERRVNFLDTIGQKLITLRGERDIDDVAKAIGVTKQAIWNYENDKRIPRDDIKRKIADYYKTSVTYIFFN